MSDIFHIVGRDNHQQSLIDVCRPPNTHTHTHYAITVQPSLCYWQFTSALNTKQRSLWRRYSWRRWRPITSL